MREFEPKKEMFYTPVILGSIRRNRESVKVARFVVGCLKQRGTVETELLDLKELDLPMMERAANKHGS